MALEADAVVIPHIELVDRHVSAVRKIVIISTACMIFLNVTIAITFLLSWSSMKRAFEMESQQTDVLSARLDRNYETLKELREATINHCKIVHGIDLNLQAPDAGS